MFYWKKSVCQIDDPACQQIEAETVLNFEHQPCLFVKFAKFVNFVKCQNWESLKECRFSGSAIGSLQPHIQKEKRLFPICKSSPAFSHHRQHHFNVKFWNHHYCKLCRVSPVTPAFLLQSEFFKSFWFLHLISAFHRYNFWSPMFSAPPRVIIRI